MTGKSPKSVLDEIDVRLNGVLGELGQALSQAITTFEAGGGEVRRSQSFQTPKGPVRAEAGIRVRMGGMTTEATDTVGEPQPINRPSATQKPDAPTKKADAPRDIAATIVTNDTQWSLTAELPGVAEDGLAVTATDGCLEITAKGALRAYAGRFDIPATMARDAMTVSLQNGILDITAPLADEAGG